ncbi:hypothetical protein BCV70DRAFT_21734 [Testicularia cyperi]|uniref:Uncharacterized protein n=1 Tax=Testicularia cyperi TaxID=1882483 RepID=A0A317Y0K0_9BASI|nr:hypothetical protein BCV70DRAFT_21734 [Testicularia cyperi]
MKHILPQWSYKAGTPSSASSDTIETSLSTTLSTSTSSCAERTRVASSLPSKSDVSFAASVMSTPSQSPPKKLQRRRESGSRLAKPFRSPLVHGNLGETYRADKTDADSPRNYSSSNQRAERSKLESRLLLLQQAEKCLRDGLLNTLPQDICTWRQAGRAAAEDLWQLTGANLDDIASVSSLQKLAEPRGDYGLESQASTQESEDEPRRKSLHIDHASLSAPGPILQRRFTRRSPGAEEQARALRSGSAGAGVGSQGSSDLSLPNAGDMIRRAQSKFSSRGRTKSTSLKESFTTLDGEREDPDLPSDMARFAADRGIEKKWNVGRMLDQLGADKRVLGWNIEEEEFQD